MELLIWIVSLPILLFDIEDIIGGDNAAKLEARWIRATSAYAHSLVALLKNSVTLWFQLLGTGAWLIIGMSLFAVGAIVTFQIALDFYKVITPTWYISIISGFIFVIAGIFVGLLLSPVLGAYLIIDFSSLQLTEMKLIRYILREKKLSKRRFRDGWRFLGQVLVGTCILLITLALSITLRGVFLILSVVGYLILFWPSKILRSIALRLGGTRIFRVGRYILVVLGMLTTGMMLLFRI